jgi:tetratricopeptide (TPR) repeat protein
MDRGVGVGCRTSIPRFPFLSERESETFGAADRASRIKLALEANAMAAKVFRRLPSVLAFALATSLAAGAIRAQNAHLGTESGLDRAMQQNAVKDIGIKPVKTVKVDKAEEAAYKAFLASQNSDPAMRIQLGEYFTAKFPSSHYLPGVYGVLTSSYFATGDTDKMFTAGNKAIQLDPQNADVLSLMAMAIPRRVKPTAPDGAQLLQAAEGYAHRAIEIIPAMTKPDAVDDATFEKAKNDKLALAHSGLGLMDFNNKKFEEARTELTQAVQLASAPDPVDYYLLGNADYQASYLNSAIAAYQKCAATGTLGTTCQAREEAVKKEAAAGTKLSRD